MNQAFVKRHSAQEYTLRYFTPKAEVELCGHATIASFFLLRQKGWVSGRCLCHTKAGDLQIEAGDKVMMQMAKPRIEDIPEESATGTANASLTYYLQQCGCLGKEAECAFIQGEAMGRPSVVATSLKADGTIYVGGTAVVVAEGMLIVD